MSRLGRTIGILSRDISRGYRGYRQFGRECRIVFPKIKQEIDLVPEKVFGQTVDIFRDIQQNWEAGSILLAASVGVTFVIGKVVMKIPLPPIIERKFVAPALSAIIVRGIAKHGERRVWCG